MNLLASAWVECRPEMALKVGLVSFCNEVVFGFTLQHKVLFLQDVKLPQAQACQF